jgi:glycosyltransferase involved in cell wall biosynthesis
MSKDNSIAIVMPIHNQQDIIAEIIQSIFQNSSKNVGECIFVLDGCTDNTEEIVVRNLVDRPNWMDIKLIHTEDVFEVKACNEGFYRAVEDGFAYSLNIQDDMRIDEFEFDKRLLEPFSEFSNLLGVTARDAVDARLVNGEIDYYNVAGKDVNTSRDWFCVRDIINRGPILFKNSILKELNFLDEDFAPIAQDESDLCFRAYRKGYIVGSYVIDYYSPLEWGQTRKNIVSNRTIAWSEKRNLKMLVERHKDLILAEKHSRDYFKIGEQNF